METLLLVINIILAVILVLLVLFQKSEGGALGIGISQDNFMFSRSNISVLEFNSLNSKLSPSDLDPIII